MTYAEKLKHPLWQKKRLEILKEFDFKCMWCGDDETTLHVHHTAYIGKNPWDTPNDFLQCLCEDCHALNHLQFTPLEELLIDAFRSRERYNRDMIKMFNRVVRNIKDGK